MREPSGLGLDILCIPGLKDLKTLHLKHSLFRRELGFPERLNPAFSLTTLGLNNALRDVGPVLSYLSSSTTSLVKLSLDLYDPVYSPASRKSLQEVAAFIESTAVNLEVFHYYQPLPSIFLPIFSQLKKLRDLQIKCKNYNSGSSSNLDSARSVAEALFSTLRLYNMEKIQVINFNHSASEPFGYLHKNASNYFAETEQVAFCTSNIVQGTNYSNNPMLLITTLKFLVSTE